MRRIIQILTAIAAQTVITVCRRFPSAIRIISLPSNTNYWLGEALDISGLRVEAVYNDETAETITGWTVSGYNKNCEGIQTLTVS